METKLKYIARNILLCIGYRGKELEKLVSTVDDWYPIWTEFKALALADVAAGLRPGKAGYRSQMHLLHEIRMTCPGRGNKPFEVSNEYAPVFARIFNSLKGEYFVIKTSKKVEGENETRI